MRLIALTAVAFLGTTLMISRAEAGPPQVWVKKCAKCHGDDGKAATAMGKKLKIGDMTTSEWQKKRKDADMKKTVAEGNKSIKHPAFKGKVSDKELDEVLKFVRGLKK